MKKMSKGISLLLAFTMVFLSLFQPAAAASVEENTGMKSAAQENLLLHYNFQDEVSGGIITDVSGNENNGQLLGTGASVQEGVLTLPGGSAGGSAAYVELPRGMFDKQNTISISVWLKNKTGKGNYAAMFFGNVSNYWLLNPCSPNGVMKSVVTGVENQTSPWLSEHGISPTTPSMGIPGPSTGTDWALYTTVITPGKIAAYYNNTYIGSVNTPRTISDYGTGLLGYIGKSTYKDIFYNGSVKEVKVYSDELTLEDVTLEYYTEFLRMDQAALSFEETDVLSDLTLTNMGQYGSAIRWTSSAPDVISETGKVTRPAEGEGNAEVVLTAHLSALELPGTEITKEFTLHVLEDSPKKLLEYTASRYELGITQVSGDFTAPQNPEESVTLSWQSSSDAIHMNGNQAAVTRPESGTGNTKVTLTAVFSIGEDHISKEFEVEVLEEDYGLLAAYVVSGNTDKSDTLHYAYSKDGSAYTPLLNNKGIVYTALGSRQMGSPSLFRKPDGSMGLISSDNNANSYVTIYETEDLIQFTNPRYVKLNASGIKVTNPYCYYETSDQSYHIQWEDGVGKSYEVTSKDLKTFSAPAESGYVKEQVEVTGVAGAMEASLFQVTRKEYESIINKYSRVTNTRVQEIPAVTVESGADLELPNRVTLDYSDGSTKNMGVSWNKEDIKGIDFSKGGQYEVRGTVMQPQYSNPLVMERADPDVVYNEEDGYYYFIGSYPTYNNNEDNQGIGYDRLALRRSKTLQGLKNAVEVEIWNEHNDPIYDRYIWAPELHKIGDFWYIMTTTSPPGNKWGIRPTLFKCTDGTDLMNPKNWQIQGRMLSAPGDDAFIDFSLDMTYFESGGKSYVCWPEKKMGNSDLYIATIDPQNPIQLTSKAIRLTTPEFGWEHGGNTWVDEGPAAIFNNGKIYLCFSAAAVDDTYCIGMLSADENADLTDLSSWTKNLYPLLTSEDFDGLQYGPGHNSFTIDEYGNPVIVYHARQPKNEWIGDGGLNDPGRHARIKSLNFAADGSPILNMTAEEELGEAYKSVSMKVVVIEKKVTLSYKASTGGKITGNTSQIISKGSDAQTVTAVPDSGYLFSKWDDGVLSPSRTDRTVTGDMTLTALFVKQEIPAEKVTVTYKALPGGKITGSTTQTIIKGGSTTEVTAVPNSGYEFSKWSDGLRTAHRSDVNVASSKTVTAEFTKKQIPQPAKVKLNYTKITLGLKETAVLKASVSPSNASSKVTWSSNNKGKVSVSSTGKITGKKTGTAKITAKTANGKKSVCVVTVKKAPTKITLNEKTKTLKKGKTFTVKVKLPAKTASNKLTFTSSNKKVAEVSSKGKITARKKGTATITVKTYNKKSEKIKIVVK